MKPSRRLRPILLLLTVGLLAGLAALVWQGPREPHYRGQSLSGWLSVDKQPHGSMGLVVSPQAADAVRHIGTNALPFLVSWIGDDQTQPPWKRRQLDYVSEWDLPGKDILLEMVAKRELRAERASSGFEILGEAAAPAIPDLVRVANQGNSASARAATLALAYLGVDALEPLLVLTTNRAFLLSNEAMMSAMVCVGRMQHLPTNAHPAVVLLIQYLANPDLATRAAEVLGMLGLESDICVPALVECTCSSRQDLRVAAATSLGRFGRRALPDLLKMLDNPSVSVRNAATNALLQIAPQVLQPTSAP